MALLTISVMMRIFEVQGYVVYFLEPWRHQGLKSDITMKLHLFSTAGRYLLLFSSPLSFISSNSHRKLLKWASRNLKQVGKEE
jgi:hypothetical protein